MTTKATKKNRKNKPAYRLLEKTKSSKRDILNILSHVDTGNLSHEDAHGHISNVISRDDLTLSQLADIVAHIKEYGSTNPFVNEGLHEDISDAQLDYNMSYAAKSPEEKRRRAAKYLIGAAALGLAAPHAAAAIEKVSKAAPGAILGAAKSAATSAAHKVWGTASDPATYKMLATHAKHALGYYSHGVGHIAHGGEYLASLAKEGAHHIGDYLLQ